MRLPFKKAAVPVALILSIAGCSTSPVYDWRKEQSDLTKPYEINPDAISMTGAVTYLQKARNGYRSQISTQAKDESTASQWILGGTGALLAAAGLKAHTDVLLVGGTALSTGYAMSTSSMPRGRVLSYMAGVDALNCAEASVAPIRTFNNDALALANKELKSKIGPLQTAVEKVTTAYKKAGPQAISVKDQTDSAEATITAANTVVSSTDDFLAKAKTASYLLYNQVEKVDAAVTRSIINGMPTLADIKVLAGGIGADMTSIVSSAVNDANASKSSKGLTGSDSGLGAQAAGETSPLSTALKELSVAQENVNAAIDKVKDNLPPNANNLNMQAMADCNLPLVPAPLSVNPTAVQFYTNSAATKTFEFKGGTKEYVADVAGLPSGLSVKQAGPGGTTLEISADASKLTAVTAPYNLRIHDQTNGGSTVSIRITIIASPAAAAANPAAAAANPADEKPGLDGKTIEVAKIKYTLSHPTTNADKTITVLLCPKIPDDDKGKAPFIKKVQELAGGTTIIKVDTSPACQK
ncbi:hypothetical protein [Duganella sp. S19_KUP01_CR8]|uniref:hypothetical protein n=1 Tax=Duganella sp. S19_KUP01_CR8 TaxID=3025502 RepID=UPI002FCDD167